MERICRQHFSGTWEVVVVDGSREGSTIAGIRNDKAITLVSPPGRGCQMNAGAGSASGDILLFLHCDTLLPENGLESVRGLMKDPSVIAGAFDLSIDAKGVAFRIIEKTASFRSRITKIPYGDQAIFIRKSYFFDIGQYRNIPIMEDVDLMMRIKKAKGRIQFLTHRVSTSSRRWKKEGVLHCTLRNWLILTLFFMGMGPEKLADFYEPHPDR